MANQSVFAWQPQPARRGSARNNERARLNRLFADGQFDWTFAQIGFQHVAHVILGAEAHGLLPHVFDQFRSLDAFRKAGENLHQRRHP